MHPNRHSGPQSKVEPFTIIDDPAAWTASDYPDLEQHVQHLTYDDIVELDVAVATSISSGKEVQVNVLPDTHVAMVFDQRLTSPCRATHSQTALIRPSIMEL